MVDVHGKSVINQAFLTVYISPVNVKFGKTVASCRENFPTTSNHASLLELKV